MLLFNVLIIIAFGPRGSTQNWLPGSSFRLRFNPTTFEPRFTTVNLWYEFYPRLTSVFSQVTVDES